MILLPLAVVIKISIMTLTGGKHQGRMVVVHIYMYM